MDIQERQKIANALITFQTLFNGALDEIAADDIEQLAQEVTVETDSVDQKWLGTVAGLEEWIGDRKLSTLRSASAQLAIRDWANGIRVHRNTIVDDKLGMVRPRIQMLAQKGRQHRPKRMVEVLANGFDGANPRFGTGLAYDGAFYFSDDHRDGDGPVQSNKGTAPLGHEAYGAARARMEKLVDEFGDPLSVRPTHLLVGPDLRTAAKEILGNRTRVVGGAAVDNIYFEDAALLVSPRLVGPWAAYWFLLDLSQLVRPLILYLRQALRFVAVEDDTNESVFMRKELKYGSDARYEVGYGLWQFAFGSDGSEA